MYNNDRISYTYGITLDGYREEKVTMKVISIFLSICFCLLSACTNDNNKEELLTNVPQVSVDEDTHDLRFSFVKPEENIVLQRQVSSLTESFEYWVNSQKIVGGELLLMQNNTVFSHKAMGWDDKDTDKALDLNKIFYIGRLSYLYIEIAMMVLTENGNIDVCQPVANYLPIFDNEKSKSITVEHLIRHSSGITHSYYQKSRKEYESHYQAIEEIATEGPDAVPGTTKHGSHINYDILVALIETISGMSLHDFLTEKIVQPLALENTFFDLSQNLDLKNDIVSRYGEKINGSFIKDWDNSLPEQESTKWVTKSAYSSIVDYAILLSLWNYNVNTQGEKIISDKMFNTLKEVLLKSVDENNVEKCLFEELQKSDKFVIQSKPRYLGGSGSAVIAMPKYNLLGLYFTQSQWNSSQHIFWSKMTDTETVLNWY